MKDEEINELSFGMMKIVDERGYTLVYLPEHLYANKRGYVLEHRFLVEKKIGRILIPTEPVHHINEKKWDNHIENLFPFHTQREHQSFHNKVKQFGFTNHIKKVIAERWEKFK